MTEEELCEVSTSSFRTPEGRKNIDPICHSLPVYISFKDTDGGILCSSSFLCITGLIISREDFVRKKLVLIGFFVSLKRRTVVFRLNFLSRFFVICLGVSHFN